MLFSSLFHSAEERDDIIRPQWQLPETKIFFRKSIPKEVPVMKPKPVLLKHEMVKLLQDIFFAHQGPTQLFKFCEPRRIELQHCFDSQERVLNSSVEALRQKLAGEQTAAATASSVSKAQSAAALSALREELQQQKSKLESLQYMKKLMSQECNTYALYRMALLKQQEEEQDRIKSTQIHQQGHTSNDPLSYIDPFDAEERRLFGSQPSADSTSARSGGNATRLPDHVRQGLLEYFGYIFGDRQFEESSFVAQREWKGRKEVLDEVDARMPTLRQQISVSKEVCEPCIVQIENLLNCPLAALGTHAEEMTASSCRRELAETRVAHYAFDLPLTDLHWNKYSKCIDRHIRYLEKHGKPIQMRKSIMKTGFQNDLISNKNG